ncbi:cupin domain-containing protein [Ancylobacter radicis]|uniref:Cupin domain-containing protein n=1 Tax=Ancylobacter radicis TaxID=2836179 RepID=A0ABS5RB69_9HYPH|nr:cupin domain-containing protein [Ancylobacter radicis]MBS9478918.1 cupin domain-containing protein [Ancylobacter radicis]
MEDLSRRAMLAASAFGGVALAAGAAHAASFGNPDQPAQGAVNAAPGALSDPGPQNPALANQIPAFESPPATDVGSMPMNWSSFNIMPKRIQAGGWARQLTATEFPASKEVSGVNMRLAAGGIREMHWHLASEWALMTRGHCRVTMLDKDGRAYVQDVGPGDLWFFPAGYPHSLQGLGPDGCEFLIVFDDAYQSEYNTLLLTDWFAHTPPKILAQNFGVPEEAFKNIPLHDLWIFQGELPPPLAVDQAAVASAGVPPLPFTFSLGSSQPVKENESGKVQLADSRTFKVSNTIAGAIETIKPGALRRMHWHPNADEWQYWMKGQGRMTVFNAGPRAQTIDFKPGDVGVVPKSQGHYIENTGNEDIEMLVIFKAPEYQEVDLADWLSHAPPELVAQHLNIDPAIIARFPKDQIGLQPG